MTPMFSTIRIDQLEPSPTNPRKTFDEAAMSELTRSVQAQGILQPILVRPTGKQAAIGARLGTGITDQVDGDLFEIVAGERRYRAARAAGLTEVPCMVRALTDIEVLRIQVIENLQRKDLNELEEAEGYQLMMREHGYTALTLAEEVHKSPEYIYGRLKLLALMPDVRRALQTGRIQASVALLIARLRTEKLQTKALQLIAARNEKVDDGGARSFRNTPAATASASAAAKPAVNRRPRPRRTPSPTATARSPPSPAGRARSRPTWCSSPVRR